MYLGLLKKAGEIVTVPHSVASRYLTQGIADPIERLKPKDVCQPEAMFCFDKKLRDIETKGGAK